MSKAQIYAASAFTAAAFVPLGEVSIYLGLPPKVTRECAQSLGKTATSPAFVNLPEDCKTFSSGFTSQEIAVPRGGIALRYQLPSRQDFEATQAERFIEWQKYSGIAYGVLGGLTTFAGITYLEYDRRKFYADKKPE